MSDDIGQAIGAILGIAFGGIVLIKMAAELNSTGPVNMVALGVLYLIAGIVLAVVLVYGLVNSLME